MNHEGGFVERRFSAPDGLELSARIYPAQGDAGGAPPPNLPPPTPLPVVCLAGLSRNARDFHDLALRLARDPERPRMVASFDYRGRGRSGYDSDWKNYNARVEATDVMAGLAALGIARAAFIGTSRGGLVVFMLAAMQPGAIAAAVLNDIGPVIGGAGLAAIRAFLERAPKPSSFEEAAQILKAANGTAFSALGEADWLRMAHATHRDEGGRPVADFDPNLLKTLRGMDFSRPLPEFWPQFMGLARVPVLSIRGDNSTLLSRETLEEMARRHPRMETLTVPGQGHPPLLETGDLPQRIGRFLAQADKATT